MASTCPFKDLVGILVGCAILLSVGGIYLFWPHVVRRRLLRKEIPFYEATPFFRVLAPLVRRYVESTCFLIIVRLIGIFALALAFAFVYMLFIIQC